MNSSVAHSSSGPNVSRADLSGGNMSSSEKNSFKFIEGKVKSMPQMSVQTNEKAEKTLIIVSYRLPYFVKLKKRKLVRMSTSQQTGQSIESLYDFVDNIDPLIDSLYSNLVSVKLNLIWVGICNIFIESKAEQKELRDYMLIKYNCYPLFFAESVCQIFARQFCSKFQYQSPNQGTFYEEEESWLVYKKVNKEVTTELKKITAEHTPIFAILVYDFHFFLVPSLFSKNKKGHQVQQFDQASKIAISFFINRKFPSTAILDQLPQADIIMHSLFFCDIMSFSTYESCEPFITFAQKMGCTLLHKSGGKIMLQCNGREIFIRIEHPGINITKLQETKVAISSECQKLSSILHNQNKHLIVGVDSISKNSGFETKFKAFEKFLKREKLNKTGQEYKLKQIVYFSSDSEFFTLTEQQEYLDEIRGLARSINQSQSFYDSVIEIIEGDTLSLEEYFQYLSLSECFFSTVLQETRHFHYMEYLFLRKDGQLILSNCLNQIAQFNSIHVSNPQDQQKIVVTLVKIFTDVVKQQRLDSEQKILIGLQAQTKQIMSPATLISEVRVAQKQGGVKQSPHIQEPSKPPSLSTLAVDALISYPNNGADRSRISITEKNSTSVQAQREFDYNYLIKFCSSQKWINHLIGDIVKRQSVSKDTCVFCSTESRSVMLDYEKNELHTEHISKIYERPASQYIEINLQNLIYKSKNAKNIVFVFGFSSVFFEHPSNLLSEPNINTKLFQQIEELSKKPNVTIYIISGKSPELLAKYFSHIKNIVLFSYNGLRVQVVGQDYEPVSLTKQYDPTFWKMCIANRMDNFVQKTAGSYVIESEIATSWHFENVEKEFAVTQKDELVRQLLQIVESMPGNEIFEGYDFIQVRPSCLNKGKMTKLAIQNSFLEKNHKVDVLIVVGGRKTTDEEMLKSARELIFEEKQQWIDSNATLILGSISSQLGALYCNHQFENNQELAVLLELMNGNKNLLQTDQFSIGGGNNHLAPSGIQTSGDQRLLTIPKELPHLFRQGTLGQIDANCCLQEESEDYNSLPVLELNVSSSSMQPSTTIELLQKKQKIKAFDIKIPFVNQTHSLNFIAKQMI